VQVPRARGRFVAATTAVVACGALALALGLWRRGPKPDPEPTVVDLNDPSLDWHPRAAEIPDGGCPAVESADAAGARADAGALTRFAVIGDYGFAGPAEEAVADMVKAWRPEFLVTLGDNNYPLGAADTIDLNIGLFYHDYIAPYIGRFGCGAARNRFFPALGNHDWMTGNARPYLDYFELPGNERYYDFVWGPVQLFALDSDPSEPDGITAESVQALWLKQLLAASTARWKIVYMHHAPYSSGPHGSTPAMRWPYKTWGVDLVLAGHDHTYERVEVDGLPYLVNGLGGTVFYPLGTPVEGSVKRFNEREGAIFVEADATSLRARFQTVDGRQIDTLSLAKP
jgi:tartrate-resistant acid phosphatase type 5